MQQRSEWPNNGVAGNRWYSSLIRFIITLQFFSWSRDNRFKYVNIRIDTRNGNFIVLTDDKDGMRYRVDPNDIARHVDMKAVDEKMTRIRNGLAVISDEELGL
ncbi:hypothetical protein [Bradyrhizobium sp. SZCCHNS3053]|uniref:hypothetical protein n=1 Tax=Bradyrhizobium sp. SZCCHNS3053 TaxID=3057322 RepID=UPI002916A9A3|nr:hypothetical protein [Bradyrhizobium sp. SZCCHNS3053]